MKPSPAGKFFNIQFRLTRGSDNSVHTISLADLPNQNLHDWILLFNILLTNSKEYEPILSHLKRMLASYILEVTKMDQNVAHVMRKRLTVKPTGKTGDVNKMKRGQIDSYNIIVMFARAKSERFFVRSC